MTINTSVSKKLIIFNNLTAQRSLPTSLLLNVVSDCMTIKEAVSKLFFYPGPPGV